MFYVQAATFDDCKNEISQLPDYSKIREELSFKLGRLKDAGVDQGKNGIFASTECQPNIFFNNYLN